MCQFSQFHQRKGSSAGVEEHLAYKSGLRSIPKLERRVALQEGPCVGDLRAVNSQFLNNLRKSMHAGQWRLGDDEGQSVDLWVRLLNFKKLPTIALASALCSLKQDLLCSIIIARKA
jgi:hypothetical protein